MYRDNEDFYKLFSTYQLPFAGDAEFGGKSDPGRLRKTPGMSAARVLPHTQNAGLPADKNGRNIRNSLDFRRKTCRYRAGRRGTYIIDAKKLQGGQMAGGMGPRSAVLERIDVEIGDDCCALAVNRPVGYLFLSVILQPGTTFDWRSDFGRAMFERVLSRDEMTAAIVAAMKEAAGLLVLSDRCSVITWPKKNYEPYRAR